jgi:hypothetical protein
MNTQKYDNRINTYILNSDEIAAGASKLMLDMFNNTSTDTPIKDILIFEINISTKTDVAVTGVVNPRFDLYRTSSAGTGGTGFSYNGVDTTVLNISSMDTLSPSLAGGKISARTAPSGGATKKSWLTSVYAMSEETNSAAITQQNVNILPQGDHVEPFVLRAGEGLLIQQGTVASLNSYIITIVFGVVQEKLTV